MDTEIVPGSSADRPKKDRRQRSRITNGSALLPNIDGRSVWARIARDTKQSLEAHCAGEHTVTRGIAIGHASAMQAELLYLEDEFARARAEGREPDLDRLDLHGRLVDRQRRLIESAIGWASTPLDVTPSLAEIQAEHDADEVKS